MAFTIGKSTIGHNKPVFIIAELSANHGQKFETAVKTLRMIKQCGADAVKLQTYTPDTLTFQCSNKYFRIKHGTAWDGQTLYELYQKAYTPWEWQPKLKKIAQEIGLEFFSTPFDKSSVDFLETMDVPAYKLASFEITDIPLIEYIAAKKKPVLISTGVAHRDDIQKAVDACRRKGNKKIALLKCASSYPTIWRDVNLRMIPRLAQDFSCVVGLSDHSEGICVPVAAVACGAVIIEKHFILDRKMGGPDAHFSLEPDEFHAMASAIRQVEKALGKVTYELAPAVKKNRYFVRSLFAVENIKQGEYFTEKNVRSIRPGAGMHPEHFKKIIGRKSKMNIKRGTPLRFSMVAS